MPYTIRKQKCKQSDGTSGSYVLSYTDKNGKKHRNCHTSHKKAQGQIAAIEAEGVQKESDSIMKIKLNELRAVIREIIKESMALRYEKKEDETNESEFTYAIAKAAKKGDKTVDIDGEKFPVKMSKKQAEKILDELDEDT